MRGFESHHFCQNFCIDSIMGYIRDRLRLLYPDMKVYGIYRNNEGRKYVVFSELDARGKVVKRGRRFSMALARAAMQAKLGRILEPWEEVDHKDGDCSNDKWSNYQILDKRQHRRKSADDIALQGKRTAIWVQCPRCHVIFYCRGDLASKAKQNARKPCCSRRCARLFYPPNKFGRNQFSRKCGRAV